MFNTKEKAGKARVGELTVNGKKIESPFFMPVATKAAPKYLTQSDLGEIGIQCFISNAYLLFLKPGIEIIEKFNGLHNFMQWDKGIFTDSGGFQILDPSFLIKSSEKGVKFRSPFEGSVHFLTPEKVMEIESRIGSDVAMALDDVPHYGNYYEHYKNSLKKTLNWAERCRKSHDEYNKENNRKQLLFGISQGGTFKDLREKGIGKMNEMNFDGIALGGLCIGEPKEKMHEITKICTSKIPENKPRYLMGVGSPDDILEAISNGIDCFDSAHPTRVARHGMYFTKEGNKDLKKAENRDKEGALDETCDCFVCKKFSKAYLHHLIRCKEPNAKRYISYHNIHFIKNMLNETKTAIREGEKEFNSYKKKFLEKYRGQCKQ